MSSFHDDFRKRIMEEAVLRGLAESKIQCFDNHLRFVDHTAKIRYAVSLHYEIPDRSMWKPVFEVDKQGYDYDSSL